MANARIIFDNALQGAWNLYADGWWNGDPSTLNNLKYPPLAQCWITNSLAAADCRFTFGLAGNPPLAAIVLANHNLSTGATVRVQASNLADFSVLLYDSTAVPAYPAGVTDAAKADLLCNFVHVLSTPTAATYWRVALVDAANPKGYLTVGRLMCARAVYQPTINMLTGASIGLENKTEAQEALSGAEWFNDRAPARTARFRLDRLSANEAMRSAFTLQLTAAGQRRELLFQYDPDDGEHAVRRTIFGRLRTLSAIEEPYFNALQTAFEVKELLP